MAKSKLIKREELNSMLANAANAECIRLWRWARRAEAKGCSQNLVNAIREEGWRLYNLANVWDSYKILSESFIWAFNGGDLLWEN